MTNLRSEVEIKKAAKEFAEFWQDKGYEKGESQKFWLSFLSNILGIEHPEKFISFEDQVKLDHTSFIDGLIPSTHVLIEQKSSGKNLRAGIKQSDGSLLNPFQQAKRYAAELPYSDRPRWIITCNFQEFLIYDMEKPNGEPEQILLKDLPKEYYRFQFMVDTGNDNIRKEMEISIEAGRLVGVIYDALLKQYRDPTNPESLKSLNMLCVRLVFCLYAEDSNLFGSRLAFHDYLKNFKPNQVRQALIDLFKVLDTKIAERDPYLDETLAEFPYVNGGLFANENIEIPQFNEEIVNILLHDASEEFDWSEISPTIFGAVFESTLNPETRRAGGMHYTSIENIHKVIDPLFLNDLKAELATIKEIKVEKIRRDKLVAYRSKLASLTFLDPACGSGNFLTETYISLRKLENEALMIQSHDQMMIDTGDIIQVSLGQFYGIEINDFAVTVAKTALWISESQMMKATEMIVNRTLEFFPLKSYANIVEANALRIDWNDVVPKNKLNYIMGNPPFVGHQWRKPEQCEDMKIAFYDLDKHGKLDYVCAWYNKAADYMRGTKIITAFVSTNSIVQGESVGILWKFLFEKKNILIEFAHQSFEWASEANLMAHVWCVIIGFTLFNNNDKKRLYTNGRVQMVDNINGYLLNAPTIFIESRGKTLQKGFPEMSKGSQPTDGGNLIFTTDEYFELIQQYPTAQKFIKKYLSTEEYINNTVRYCLWLDGISPHEYRKIPPIIERLNKVAECRRNSPTPSVKQQADTPMLFTQIRQPNTDYLVIPKVSSQRRKYIPIGFMKPDVICNDMLCVIENASMYMFGVLISNVHMAWMRTVCGRLGMGYRYTPAVYNNFPWPTPTAEQKAKIEQTAQSILDARAKYPNCSLADLYDEITMPKELRQAHQANDKAVMQAYGFDIKTMTESECVAELFKLYQKLVGKK